MVMVNGLKFAVVALAAAMLPAMAAPPAKPPLSPQAIAAQEAAAQKKQLVNAAQSNRAAAIQSILNKWGGELGDAESVGRLQAVLEAMPAGKLADIMASASYAEVKAILAGGGSGSVDAGILDLGDLQADLVLTAINPPCRAVDTRNIGGPIPASSTRNWYLWGAAGFISPQGGNPSGCPNPKGFEGPLAGSINVTAIPAGFNGHLRVFPYLAALPTVSFVNFTTANIANAGIISICPGVCARDISIYNAGAVHYAVDVMGFFYRATEVPLGFGATGATTPIGTFACVHYAGADVTITVPGPGYITVTSQVNLIAGTSNDAGYVAIDTNTTNCDFSGSYGYFASYYGFNSESYQNVGVARTFFVGGPGTYTYYVNGYGYAGNGVFYWAGLQARYSPQ